MKKSVSILLMLVAVITLTACGSELDKTGQEFKNKIIEDRSNLYDEDYKEGDFSFLIYKDKDSNRYLSDVWVPYEGKDSELERFYSFDENKDLIDLNNQESFNDVKDNGNYEVIYKTGKFK